MKTIVKAVQGDESGRLKGKISAIYALLIVFNIAAWAWAFIAFHDYPLLMGTSLLAYTLRASTCGRC